MKALFSIEDILSMLYFFWFDVFFVLDALFWWNCRKLNPFEFMPISLFLAIPIIGFDFFLAMSLVRKIVKQMISMHLVYLGHMLSNIYFIKRARSVLIWYHTFRFSKNWTLNLLIINNQFKTLGYHTIFTNSSQA